MPPAPPAPPPQSVSYAGQTGPGSSTGRTVVTAAFGLHDDSRKDIHQGRLIGSVSTLIWGLALLAPVFGLVFALIAIAIGTKALSTAKKEPGRYSGAGLAKAGLTLSLVSVGVHVLLVIVVIVFNQVGP